MEQSARPDLYLPVEVKPRELRGKLLLALSAARAGWRVHLGRSGSVQMLALTAPSPGLFLDKNINARRAALFDALRARGHRVLAWDEEGLAVLNYDWYVTKNIKPDMLARVDAFLCWGDAERDVIAARHPGLAGRLVVTGNPRGDMLRPALQGFHAQAAAELRQRYGEYILLVSSFSRVNRFSGDRDAFVETLRVSFSLDDDNVAFLRSSLDHFATIFAAFLALVPRLAARFPDRAIVIRPHPAEDHATWRAAAQDARVRGLPNVHVVYEGDIVPWLIGAGAILHNGCTTAIEAFAMGRLPVAYRPVTSERYDVDLPNELSICADDEPDLFLRIDDALARPRHAEDDPDWQTRAPALRKAFVSLDGPLACERILAALETVRPQGTPARVDTASYDAAVVIERARLHRTRLLDPLRRLKAALTRRRFHDADAYRRQTFDGLTIDEMRTERARFDAALPGLDEVRIADLGHDCFTIEAGPSA